MKPYRFLVGMLVLLLGVSTTNRAQDMTDVHQADGDATKPTGRSITLSDFGAEDVAFLAIPATPPTLGIVLVPDAFGLDDFTKAEAIRLAGEGYLVAAVDIYNGHQTTDPGLLANMTANMDDASVQKTITAGIRLFHESPKFRADHVIVMGWGTGANYAFETARTSKTVDGVVTFYGPVEDDPARVHHFAAPLCALYPDVDAVATHDRVHAFQQAMKEAGSDFEAWYIAAGRGWSNPKSKNYNPVEDKEAWKVALPFIVRIGALPARPKDASIIDKAKDKIENIFH